jgi:hypothetical protein
MGSDRNARVTILDEQVGIFIPLGQRVKINLKLCTTAAQDTLRGLDVRDGYLISEVVVSSFSFATTPSLIKIDGEGMTNQILYVGMETFGKWDVELA